MVLNVDVSPIVFDVETAGLPNAADYIDPPDLSDIAAPSNYKDELKIADYIARERERRLAQHAKDCAEGSALDWNVGRCVALAWWIEGTITTRTLPGEQAEANALREFWDLAQHRTLVGFAIKDFDLKFLIQRSRFLGIPHPLLDLGRYGRQGIVDLFAELTFNAGYYDKGVMRRSLAAFCRRFGILIDETVTGADIPALVAADNWDAVIAHVTSDVQATVALAQRLGVVPSEVAL